MDSPSYLRRNQAAAYITERYFPNSSKTLAKLAVIGGGPRYRKAGRIPIYERPDLDAWAKAKLSRPITTTSELKCER
jgi:hypothetical protein